MTNRLARETSPYLLQHAANPVDWWPWGPEALAEARRRNRPILLSVGYAACHWCHVMAHESFEDAEVAALMNALFVNIKVDREERPDIDTIYQSALAMLGQHGGWPLTMFLTPDGEPFWGGTYFPKQPRFGRPGFPDVLRAVAATWADEREKVDKKCCSPGNRASASSPPTAAPRRSGPTCSRKSPAGWSGEVDPRWGGIGRAPKFPQPSILLLLWRAYIRTGEDRYRQAVTSTLTRMCQGGIYDHLAGGFARYSTDDEWLVPHFEEDALRQCPDDPDPDPGLAGDPRTAVRTPAPGDRRLGARRNDREQRRLRRHAGCRQRRRGGQVLCLDRRGDRRPARHRCRAVQERL